MNATRALLFAVFVVLGMHLRLASANACLETCCCKVCSAQTMDAFPYGLPTVPNSLNSPYPTVVGATCNVPVWSAYPYNDTNGNPLTVPPTLFWTNPSLFGDDTAHVAPTTCSCCQLSVHTSCSEAAPLATRPKTILIPSGTLIAGQLLSFSLTDGVELTSTDLLQLRRDTYCGYNGSAVITAPALQPSADQTRMNVQTTLTNPGCYSVCYFHSTLTTPTWYLIGQIVVNPVAAPSISIQYDPIDVLLGGNEVTLTFSGVGLLSPFDDIVEIRSSASTCGTAGYDVRSGVGGANILEAMDGAMWCSPAVTPKITTVRPLRYIALKYTDCPVANRVYLETLKWTVRLPASTVDVSKRVCYRRSGTWHIAGALGVLARRTQRTALGELYTATGGANWLKRGGWGTVASECTYHGVRCDANGKVVSIHLGRNNLVGPIPQGLFLSDLAASLTFLALDMNRITGTIPSTMGAMKVLKYVDLGFNEMTGSLPVPLLGMDRLDVVYISNNQFVGDVPDRIDKLSLQWLRNELKSPDPVVVVPECPVDEQICVDQGSTAPGVFACGYDGITEMECVVMGCCFNAQAPLVFGGSTCFTKRSRTFFTYPQCTSASCIMQADVIQ